jgi:hypothetical protein
MPIAAGSPDASLQPSPGIAPGPRVLDYPHILRCAACREYLEDAPSDAPSATVVCAVLTYHDSVHRLDPLGGGGHGQFSWI